MGSIRQEIFANPELKELLYEGMINFAIEKMFRIKQVHNVSVDWQNTEIRKFAGDDGLAIRMQITSDTNKVNTVEFRFFFCDLVDLDNYEKIDKKAGILDKHDKLSFANIIKLRIL